MGSEAWSNYAVGEKHLGGIEIPFGVTETPTDTRLLRQAARRMAQYAGCQLHQAVGTSFVFQFTLIKLFLRPNSGIHRDRHRNTSVHGLNWCCLRVPPQPHPVLGLISGP